ncbi:MAG: aspartate aminotransferase family protein [Anaerolineae bacterium]|nr:aspartate aminotransferase family protein [Anaerolineae bacterium]
MRILNRTRLEELLKAEEERFLKEHPRSQHLYRQARAHWQGGVPMLWMVRWAGNFPVFVREAKGAHFKCVDGFEYIDFCLGDTGAMTGHAPAETIQAIRQQAERGITLMLPIEDIIWVGEELTRRFGLPYWQLALTATDANRFALRMARHITQRPKVLVFNYCYHGTVDESYITLDEYGQPSSRRNNLGPPIDPTLTTKVIEFNDLAALERALAPRDVAAVLAEPVMTNIGIIHPEPGYHEALREITRRTGTILIIDETHTICAGPGGYTAAHNLKPDMLTLGKPIAGGIPAAVYGFTAEVNEKFMAKLEIEDADVGGIGGTLAGNALSVAAMRATLEHVLTPAAYEKTLRLGERFEAGVVSIIQEWDLPWVVKRLGGRVEYWFRQNPPRNGGEAAAAIDAELDRYMHLFALNRRILMTPFHNMALMSRDTSEEDIDYHTQVFGEAVKTLFG